MATKTATIRRGFDKSSNGFQPKFNGGSGGNTSVVILHPDELPKEALTAAQHKALTATAGDKAARMEAINKAFSGYELQATVKLVKVS